MNSESIASHPSDAQAAIQQFGYSLPTTLLTFTSETMASTRDIRRRIKSVKNTRQITKAMELVAASKMKKAQQLALAGRPYAHVMARMLAALANRVEKIVLSFSGTARNEDPHPLAH